MQLIVSKDKEESRRALNSFLREDKASAVSFYPENFSVAAFSQEVETLPFLVQKKTVVIHDIDQLSEPANEAIYLYLQKPSDWIFLYLTATELSPQNRITKLIEKKGKVLRYKEEKPWEKEKRLAEWLIEEARLEKMNLSLQVAMALVQGVDHQMLKSELDKLLCFAYARQEITLEDISMISTRAHRETLWQLGDALFSLETARAIEIGIALLDEGMAIFLLLANLRSQFTTGMEILAAAQQGEVAQRFPYLKGKFLEKKVLMLKKYGKKRLQQGALLVFEAELKAKNSSADPALLLELLIVKLIHPVTHDFIPTTQFARTGY